MASYADTLKQLTSGYDTAKGDVTAQIEKAIQEYTGSVEEAKNIYDTLLQSEAYDPNSAASMLMGEISTGFQDVVGQMQDLSARGGFAGSPNVEGLLSSMVKTLAPQIVGRYDVAQAGKERISDQIAKLLASKGTTTSNLRSTLGTQLGTLGAGLAGKTADVNLAEQKATEENERLKQNLANQLAIAGKLTPTTAQNVLGQNAGVPASSVLPGATGNATTGGAGTGVSGAGGGSAETASLFSSINQALADLGQGSASYAGGLNARGNESALDAINRVRTGQLLSQARTNLAGNLYKATQVRTRL